jgi:methylated-DNA-protein-cysteine methyltransferase-like protein
MENSFQNFDESKYRERVFALVRQIPAGRVMTYGQIAAILGDGYTPRTVGFVMHAASADKIPWHRVINSQGGCSTARFTLPPDLQQKLLEQENVQFNDKRRCKLSNYLWQPEN